jgi:ABC-type transporter Mla subunit MlaD
MALQDLTPQLRTRLSRMERAVGWFVLIAVLLLTFGFVYYVYNTAEQKGWFLLKAPYFTFTDRATGLKVGDPVTLMGFGVGRITVIKPMPAEQFNYNVYIEFEVERPYYDYMWTEGSRAKINTADLLGKRVLEVTKGTGGYPTYVFYPLQTNVPLTEVQNLPELSKWVLAQEVFSNGLVNAESSASGNLKRTNLLAKALDPLTNLAAIANAGYSNISVLDTRQKKRSMTGRWNRKKAAYIDYTATTKPYWLEAEESAAVTERLEKLVGQVEAAIPNILDLTNRLANVLSNSVNLTSNLNIVAASALPLVTNLATVTSQLNRPGALGEWLLPTNINRELDATLGNASATLAAANTNLTDLMENLGRTLDNLANLTSNLDHQVQINTNMLTQISTTVIHADEFVQGLKRHWLLRSAFKSKKTNAPPATARSPAAVPSHKP